MSRNFHVVSTCSSGKRRRARVERLAREVQHHRAVLADRVQHDRPLTLRDCLAHDVDALRLERLEVAQGPCRGHRRPTYNSTCGSLRPDGLRDSSPSQTWLRPVCGAQLAVAARVATVVRRLLVGLIVLAVAGGLAVFAFASGSEDPEREPTAAPTPTPSPTPTPPPPDPDAIAVYPAAGVRSASPGLADQLPRCTGRRPGRDQVTGSRSGPPRREASGALRRRGRQLSGRQAVHRRASA